VFTDFLLRRAGALRIIVLLAIALVLSQTGRTRITRQRPTFREAFTDAFTADFLLIMLAARLAWQGLLWLLAFLSAIF
jgi:hypothetical protein